jgi:mannose-1-phosphate guanylyltransferase
MSPTSNTTDVSASVAGAAAMPSSAGRADAPPGGVSCVAQLAVLLAGQSASTRAPIISTSLGLPVAALPVTAERSLAACWVRRIVRAGFRGTVVLAVASEVEAGYFRQLEASLAADLQSPPNGGAPSRIEVRIDTAGHRGPAGTIGDVAADHAAHHGWRAADGGMLVIEASNAPNLDLARFYGGIDSDGGALVGAAIDGSPCGVHWMSASALALVPRIGYFDLKEQLIPAVVASGRRVHAWMGTHEPCRISDRASYLRAAALMQAAGAESIAPDAVIEAGARVRGGSMICRGATVERGALVVDAVVLPGARVCADAVVARSVVPPGSHVPRGYLVVDEVFGALGSVARSGTEGGAA